MYKWPHPGPPPLTSVVLVALGAKLDSQLEASPRPSPMERVSHPDISDSNFRSCGVIGHVLFNELLCNKFVTMMGIIVE